MKKIIILTTMLIAFSCKAQNPIVSLNETSHNASNGTYFKDLNNELNKFTGTWIYSNGSTTLTITLQKIVQMPIGNKFFDYLIGEYKYLENGLEIINTLPLLNQNNSANNIGGNYFIPNNMFVACDDCAPNERRVKLYISDPERDYLSVSLVLRYLIDETNPEKMTATIFAEHGGLIPTEDSPTSLRVPYGEYLMVKQ